MGIFATMGETMQTASNSLISSAISNIISAITPPVTTGVIIYFMITGYMVLAGRISEPIGDVCIKVFKIALVCTLCLNTSNVMSYVVDGINSIESMFIHAITGDDSTNTFQVLDNIFNKGIFSAAEAIAKTENLNWKSTGQILAFYATGIIIAITTLIMTVLAGSLIILAKIALGVILGLSPFFLAGLMFPITARWADSWFNQALNYTILSAIIIFILSLVTRLFNLAISEVSDEIISGNSFPIKPMFQLAVIACANYFVIKQAPSIASGLAGGAASAGASLTGMIYQAKQVGNWVDGAKGAAAKDASYMGKVVNNPLTRYAAEKTGIAPTVRSSIDRVKRRYFNNNSIKKQ